MVPKKMGLRERPKGARKREPLWAVLMSRVGAQPLILRRQMTAKWREILKSLLRQPLGLRPLVADDRPLKNKRPVVVDVREWIYLRC
jgi:hypothetical protein